MKNKELKKVLVASNQYQEYKQQRYQFYLNNGYAPTIDNAFDMGITKEVYTALEQLRNADIKQVSKIKAWINYWLKEKANNRPINLYFATFTYDDSKCKDISPKNLKKRVLRAISPNVKDFIINVDYGREHERLHYHALIVVQDSPMFETKTINRKDKKGKWHKGYSTKMPFMSVYENKTGFYDFEPLRDTNDSDTKLAKYITKLVNHSIKVQQSYVSTKKGSEYQDYKKARYSLDIKANAFRGLNTLDYYKFDRYKRKHLENAKDKLQIDANIINERYEQEYRIKEKQFSRILEKKKNGNVFDDLNVHPYQVQGKHLALKTSQSQNINTSLEQIRLF